MSWILRPSLSRINQIKIAVLANARDGPLLSDDFSDLAGAGTNEKLVGATEEARATGGRVITLRGSPATVKSQDHTLPP